MLKFYRLFITVYAVFLGLTSIAQVPNYIPTNGLLAWYPFNGNSLDEGGKAFHCININAKLTKDRFGKDDKAFFFNGTASLTSQTGTSPSNFTYSGWFQFTEVTDGLLFMSNYSGNKLFGFSAATASNTLRVHYIPVNSIKNLTFAVNPNIWNHVVMTYNGTVVKTYVNNIFIDSIKVTSGGTLPSVGFSIGGYKDIFFKGNIDDVAIWNRVLSKDEITGLNKACVLKITDNPSDTTVNIGTNVEFTISTSDISATHQWQTDMGSGFQNLNNTTQYKGVDNDTLKVINTNLINNNQLFRCISSSGICMDTSESAILKVKSPGGINRINETNKITVYPNPTASQINFETDNRNFGLTYILTNIYDQTLIKGKIMQNNTYLNIENLSVGVYLLYIGDKTKNVFKIIKE